MLDKEYYNKKIKFLQFKHGLGACNCWTVQAAASLPNDIFSSTKKIMIASLKILGIK